MLSRTTALRVPFPRIARGQRADETIGSLVHLAEGIVAALHDGSHPVRVGASAALDQIAVSRPLSVIVSPRSRRVGQRPQ